MESMKQVPNRDLLGERVLEIRAELKKANPRRLAANCGATIHEGQLELLFWGENVQLKPEDYVAHSMANGRKLDTFNQALLAYYLQTADGTALSGTWTGFSELPNGQFYAAAFQGYTGNELIKNFGNDFLSFTVAAKKVGGQLKTFADRAYVFQVLPRVAIMVAGWRGDEDFPPSFRLLFDSQVDHYLPTDVCAISGSVLTRRLIKAGVQTRMDDE
jgi:hypothetical protein